MHHCLFFLSGPKITEAVFDSLFDLEYYGCIIGMFEQNNLGIRKKSPIITCIENKQNLRNMYLNDNRCNTEILSKDIMSRLEPIFAEIEENGLWDNPTEETESDVGSSDGGIDDEPETEEIDTRNADVTTKLGADSTNENIEEEVSSSGDGDNLNALSIEGEEGNEDEFDMTIGDLHRYFPPLDGT